MRLRAAAVTGLRDLRGRTAQPVAPVEGLLFLSAAFALFTALAYVLTLDWSRPFVRDGTTLVVGRDFLNFWMYGRTALTADPGRFYDPEVYNHALAALLGADYPGQNWSYPPGIMLLALPFGRLGYFPALMGWTALGVALFVVVARRHLGDGRLIVALMCSPAAVLCLVSGQSSLVTAAMLIAIFAALDRRPHLAGVLIGLLTLKPQLGVLFPVMLIASGRWRVFVVAGATAVTIAAATAALFGPQVWLDYLQTGIPAQNLVLADPQKLGAPFMPTIFMNLRSAGASYPVAMAVQLGVAAVAAAAVFWAYRRRRTADPKLLTALFLGGQFAALPYLLSYDTLALAWVAVSLMARGLDPIGRRLAVLVFWLPAVQLVCGSRGLPGPALIAPAFAVYALLRLKPERAKVEADAPTESAALGAAAAP